MRPKCGTRGRSDTLPAGASPHLWYAPWSKRGEEGLSRLLSWRAWVIAVSLCLLVAACDSESEPTPEPLPTATNVPATPAATAMAPTSVLPTATATNVVQSPMTASGAITTTDAVTAVDAASLIACTQETDIALASYPDLQKLMGCALGPAIFDPVAINEFGASPDFDRFMLWFSHEGQIYVLRPDKSWQTYPDTWTEDQPTFACNPLGGEPTSPPLPRRGFGKLWCEDKELQTTMGTVAKEERLCQHTVLQPFQKGRLLACYEDATIRYFRVMDDQSWDQVLVR